jgi:hypothetical protein
VLVTEPAADFGLKEMDSLDDDRGFLLLNPELLLAGGELLLERDGVALAQLELEVGGRKGYSSGLCLLLLVPGRRRRRECQLGGGGGARQ